MMTKVTGTTKITRMPGVTGKPRTAGMMTRITRMT